MRERCVPNRTCVLEVWFPRFNAAGAPRDGVWSWSSSDGWKEKGCSLGSEAASCRALRRHHAEARGQRPAPQLHTPPPTPVPHVRNELRVRARLQSCFGGIMKSFWGFDYTVVCTISFQDGALSCGPRVRDGLRPLKDGSRDWQMGLGCCGYRAAISHYSWNTSVLWLFKKVKEELFV